MRKLFTGRFEGYSLAHFQKDLLSGMIVGVVAIPLAMSFAIASGVKPEYGFIQPVLLEYSFHCLVVRSIKLEDLQVLLFRFF